MVERTERKSQTLVPASGMESLPSGTNALILEGVDQQLVDLSKDVIDRTQKGDQDALATLYNLYQPRIYRYSLARLGNIQNAEDATSDVFVKVINSIGSFEWKKDVPFSAWIFKIAHNHLVSVSRRNNIEKSHIYPPGVLEGSGQSEGGFSSVDNRIDNLVQLEKVVEACRQLPVGYNEVIVLRFFAGLSITDTAGVLGKDRGDIKVIQHKAVERLRQILNREEAQRICDWRRKELIRKGEDTLYMHILRVFLQSDGTPIKASRLVSELSISKTAVTNSVWSLRWTYNIPVKNDQGKGYYLEQEDAERLRRELDSDH